MQGLAQAFFGLDAMLPNDLFDCSRVRRLSLTNWLAIAFELDVLRILAYTSFDGRFIRLAHLSELFQHRIHFQLSRSLSLQQPGIDGLQMSEIVRAQEINGRNRE